MIFTDINGVPDFESNVISRKQTNYCLLIPIINEGERIIKELLRAKTVGIDKVVDIIICDGGSSDGSTSTIKLEALGVNTLLTKIGPGKQGAQMRMGFWWALKRGYKGFITIDGNNKDSIEDVPSFVKKLDESYDFIQGSRFVKGGKALNTPLLRHLAVRLIHAPIISLTAKKYFTDTTNGFRGYSKKYLTHKDVKPFRDIFSTYELLAYLSVKASQLNLKTCEIPVKRIYPKGGTVPTKIKGLAANKELLDILLKNAVGVYNVR